MNIKKYINIKKRGVNMFLFLISKFNNYLVYYFL